MHGDSTPYRSNYFGATKQTCIYKQPAPFESLVSREGEAQKKGRHNVYLAPSYQQAASILTDTKRTSAPYQQTG
ncbi:uncharacterized protein DFE_2092 [Desulfovibrio ferrophilus]|uniref:Uncharacterized protein n=1 Tax=Desulfovibrio ferrophilus TaxID=241368 RepID=A0A2Z6B018_9BACT|nr:uncharacterized protein DFE_2092 [Desulfovibrio ferrophilus]